MDPRRKIGVLCAALMIFVADASTLADGLASSLYILVLVWFAEHLRRRTVLLIVGLCILAAATTYPLAHGFVPTANPIIRRLVSCIAILAVTPVILKNLIARDALLQQDILLDLTDHPIIVRNGAGIITYWNGAATRLYGWTAREAIGRISVDLLSTELSSSSTEIEIAMQKRGYWEGQAINTARNQEKIAVLSRWFVQTCGRDVNMLDIGTDITKLQQTVMQLRSSEVRHRAIFNTVNIALLEQDYSLVAARIVALRAQGVDDFEQYCADTPAFVRQCMRDVRLIDVNEGAIRMYEAHQKSELLEAKDGGAISIPIQCFADFIVAIANGSTHFTATTSLLTLGGNRISALVSVNLPAATEKMNSVLVSIVDDTARREAQETLAETQEGVLQLGQMTALGEMTAMIAHQVNHPLAAIIANSEACRRWLNRARPDFSEARAAMAAVTQNGFAATEVVSHIRTLGTQNPAQKSAFSLKEAVKDAFRLLERKILLHNIEVRTDYSRDAAFVFGDKIQIEQVILNLTANAIEAVSDLPGARKIIIRLARRDTANMELRIEDNGAGIPPDLMPDLFLPFFSTKTSGMGLGLSICRAIIDANNGEIWASNDDEGGAVFGFTLPVDGKDA